MLKKIDEELEYTDALEYFKDSKSKSVITVLGAKEIIYTNVVDTSMQNIENNQKLNLVIKNYV